MAEGDPAYAATQERLAAGPPITVPTVVLDPTEDTVVALYGTPDHARHFTRLVDVRELDCGHNPPQELPGRFADAIRALDQSLT